ncbi:MAG: SDR family NAD(P)-dependent oxidoreductase [Gammaproteobacteria bacterium]
MNASRPMALVTGASSGIGREIAGALAAQGHDLIIAARSTDALEALAAELRTRHGAAVSVAAVDLGEPDGAQQLWSQVQREGRRIEVLVNNAGVGLAGDFAQADPAATAAMLQLNVASLTLLTRLALPDMLACGRGRILHVASIAGLQPGGPGMAVYYATKNYVVSFTRALARELRGSGVTVTALCPGPTRTGFESRAGERAHGLFSRLPVMDAASVAAYGLRALRAGQTLAVPGIVNKLLALAGELPPRSIALGANARLLR